MSHIIGIDPGLTGAVVVVDSEYGIVVHIYDMPITKLSKGSKKNQVDGKALRDILALWPNSTVFLEQVQAMPRRDKDTGEEITMGSASSFNFGAGWGITFGVALCCCQDVRLVVPTVWKRYWGLLKTEKDAARVLAIQEFPVAGEALKRKKDSGRADALLIAQYGRSVL